MSCCVMSTPCLNGGTCLPSPSTTNQTRFTCSCPAGFGGKLCEVSLKFPFSCRGLAKTSPAGKYQLQVNSSGDIFETFCDFNDTAMMAWTLIQSHELQNTDLMRVPLYENAPVNENTPSWKAFRLSLPIMQSIQADSVKMRLTCNYDQDGVVYRDYAVALLTDIAVLSYQGRKCLKYEYIDIRGQHCSSCTAHTRQGKPSTAFHIDVNNTHGSRCNLYPTGIKFCDDDLSEDNFGYYRCTNPLHRCTAANTSTSQIWLGAPFQP